MRWFESSRPGRLMRILRSVVAPSTAFMAFCDSKITACGSIRSQIICDKLVRDKAIFLQQLAHEFQRFPLVPPGLDQHIENLALHSANAYKVHLFRSRSKSIPRCAISWRGMFFPCELRSNL